MLSALTNAGLSGVLEDVILARMIPTRELLTLGSVCQAWRSLYFISIIKLTMGNLNC